MIQIEDATLIAVVSGITGAIVKGLDILFTYLKNKHVKDTQDNRLEEAIRLNNLTYDIVSKEDQDSVPLVYVPRRLITQQQEYNEMLRNIVHNGEMISKTLDKMTTTLENVVRVMDRLEDKGRR